MTRRTDSRLRAALLALGFAAIGPALALKIGDAAPAFDLPAKDGDRLSLASLRGQIVYVDFWASWCGPCKQSFPWMNQLQTRFGGQGLKVVAVNVDEQTADARRFLGEVPANFAVVFDNRGTTPGAWGVEGMPTSYLIGADGKVLAVHAGFKDGDRAELETKVGAALGGVRP